MVEKDLISVIVPVYNVEKYVEKCISSITLNTYRNIEILCIDDGSTDRSGDILDRLSLEDSRISVAHQSNGGVSVARNRGLDMARGEYIAFVDADDFIHPMYFASLLGCMQTTGADIAVCKAEKVEEDVQVQFPEYEDITYHQLDAEHFFKSYYARHMICGKLYRKSDLDNLRLAPEVGYGEDTLYNLCLVHGLKSPKVYETEVRLYYYLMRYTSAVHTAEVENTLEFGYWYYKQKAKIQRNKNGWQWMLPMQAIKMTLSYRYGVSIKKKNRVRNNDANRILWSCYKDIWLDSDVPVKEKIVHLVMICFPCLYRAFRLRNDPTLKRWEREVCSQC